MTTSKTFVRAFLACLVCAAVVDATAETFRLKSGESFQGTIEHVYRGIYSVSLPDGTKRTLGTNDLVSITFVAPEPQPAAGSTPPTPGATPTPPQTNLLSAVTTPASPFGSPTATFQTWRAAAIGGDIRKIVDCYASFRQKDVRKQLKRLSKKDMDAMRETTAKTEFVPQDPVFQGDRAFLEVSWTLGLQGDNQSLQFILEKDAWKIVQ